MIVVISQITQLGKPPLSEADQLEWLPRLCPRCAVWAIVGHGRRKRQAHDKDHGWIRVRRGLCQHCEVTITVLPAWLVPGAHYSLHARADALRQAETLPLEQASPATREPDRLVDPSTMRRWRRRRAVSWLACTLTLQTLGGVVAKLLAPTMLAWDWPAAARILFPEAKPP
jgi:hypothetical protein